MRALPKRVKRVRHARLRSTRFNSVFLSPEAHITEDAALFLTSREVHQRLANACRATEKQKRSEYCFGAEPGDYLCKSRTVPPFQYAHPCIRTYRVNGAW